MTSRKNSSDTNELENKFDPNQYDIFYNSVFTESEVGLLFHSFLKKEYSHESFEFLVSLERLKPGKTKEMVALAKEIYRNFLSPSSKKEINIRFDQKNELSRKLLDVFSLDTWDIQETPMELFDPLRKAISTELRNNHFQRFIFTEEFLSRAEAFKKNEKIMKIREHRVFKDFTNDDFKYPVFTEKDHNFLMYVNKECFKQNDWVKVTGIEQAGVGSYLADRKFLPHVDAFKDAYALRYEMELDFDLETMVRTLYGTHGNIMERDVNVSASEILDFYTYEQQLEKFGKDERFQLKPNNGIVVGISHIPFPFPLNTRLFVSLSTTYFDKDTNSILVMSKLCYHDSIPNFQPNSKIQYPVVYKKGAKPMMGKAYLSSVIGATIITKVDDKKVLYREFFLCCMSGWLSGKKIYETVAKKRGTEMKIETVKFLKRMKPATDEEMEKHPNTKSALIALKEFLKCNTK